MSTLQAVALTVLPNLGGIIGALVNNPQIDTWYKSIERPPWRPPNWLFAPVWTSLYSMMGYASYLVLRDGNESNRNTALILYGSQLLLNWAWSPIFFKFHKIGLAAIEMTFLWANIIACAWYFHPINKTASYLMLPYLAWVSFANLLTISIWRRNRPGKQNKGKNAKSN